MWNGFALPLPILSVIELIPFLVKCERVHAAHAFKVDTGSFLESLAFGERDPLFRESSLYLQESIWSNVVHVWCVELRVKSGIGVVGLARTVLFGDVQQLVKRLVLDELVIIRLLFLLLLNSCKIGEVFRTSITTKSLPLRQRQVSFPLQDSWPGRSPTILQKLVGSRDVGSLRHGIVSISLELFRRKKLRWFL